MAEVNVNTLHNHTGKVVSPTSSSTIVISPTITNCPLGHSNCMATSYSTKNIPSATGSLANSRPAVSGEVNINATHSHTYKSPAGLTSLVDIYQVGKCPLNHDYCVFSASTESFHTAVGGDVSSGSFQQSGEVNINVLHIHECQREEVTLTRVGNFVSCPSGHSGCQATMTGVSQYSSGNSDPAYVA